MSKRTPTGCWSLVYVITVCDPAQQLRRSLIFNAKVEIMYGWTHGLRRSIYITLFILVKHFWIFFALTLAPWLFLIFNIRFWLKTYIKQNINVESNRYFGQKSHHHLSYTYSFQFWIQCLSELHIIGKNKLEIRTSGL